MAADHLKDATSLAYSKPPQEAGYAGLMAVAQPASCDKSTAINSSIRILRLPEVMARVGLCRASIYQHINEGSFPKQITLGPRAVGWLEHEINAWLAVKIQARRNSESFS